MNETPDWLREAEAAKARGEDGRGRAADDRARWILKGYQEYGRGGRQQVADLLGISVGEVDKALARARGLERPSGLPSPDDLLARLYALELAELPPLPEPHWQVLRHLVRSTAIDASWLEQPGELLAQEVEDLDPGDLPPGAEQAVLAQACRNWSRIQALAVLDALTGDGRGLPRLEQ